MGLAQHFVRVLRHSPVRPIDGVPLRETLNAYSTSVLGYCQSSLRDARGELMSRTPAARRFCHTGGPRMSTDDVLNEVIQKIPRTVEQK